VSQIIMIYNYYAFHQWYNVQWLEIFLFKKNFSNSNGKKSLYTLKKKSYKPLYEMTCVKNNNFSGFTPHFTLVYIFVSCVFYTVHYIRDQKKTRTVYIYIYYIVAWYIYLYIFIAPNQKKKKLFTYFYTLQWRNNNAKFFFFNLYRPTWVSNSVSLSTYIYINLYIMFVSRPLSHTHSLSV